MKEARGATLGLVAGVALVIAGLTTDPRDPAGLAEILRAPRPETLEDLRAQLAPEPGSPAHRVRIEDRDGRSMEAFHEALRRAAHGRGQARVLFYGGSHTAGDHYTGRLREVLQTRYGDAGHGFVNLVPVVHQQWRWGLVLDEAEGWGTLKPGFKSRDIERYGLAGVAFESDEPGAFAAAWSDTWGTGRAADRLEVLYDRFPGGGSFEVWIDGQRREVVSTDAEAPAGGRVVYEVSDNEHRLEVRVVGDGPVRAFGFVFERDDPGVLVDNLGLVGSKARHQLLWDVELWRGLFETRRPDLVALAYGNNESTDTHLTIAEHEAHLRRVVERLREAAPDASCLVIGPTDRLREREDGTLEPREVVQALSDMQRRVAIDMGCGFFDTLAFQGGLGGGLVWLRHDPPWMGDDRQHLTHEGYVRWGEALALALLDRFAP